MTGGDVLVFHCLTTMLRCRTESSGCLRLRWQTAQPAPRRMVIGPNGREIGSRLFGRTQWWRAVPEGLTLTEAGGLDERPVLPVPPSRLRLVGLLRLGRRACRVR